MVTVSSRLPSASPDQTIKGDSFSREYYDSLASSDPVWELVKVEVSINTTLHPLGTTARDT